MGVPQRRGSRLAPFDRHYDIKLHNADADDDQFKISLDDLTKHFKQLELIPLNAEDKKAQVGGQLIKGQHQKIIKGKS